MLPIVDLVDLLVQVNSWCSFLDELTHLGNAPSEPTAKQPSSFRIQHRSSSHANWVVALYGKFLARLYAAVSVAVAALGASTLDDSTRCAAAVLTGEIALQLAIGMFGSADPLPQVLQGDAGLPYVEPAGIGLLSGTPKRRTAVAARATEPERLRRASAFR